MIKVLAVTDGAIYPFSPEAPAEVLSQVLNILSESGEYSFEVVYGRPAAGESGGVARIKKNFRVRLCRIPDNFLGRNLSKLTLCLGLCFSLRKYDMVLFNTPPVNYFSLVLVFSYLFRKKTLYIAHGGFFLERPISKRNILIRTAQRLLFRLYSLFIDRVITVSEDTLSRIRAFFPASDFSVVHNGITPVSDDPGPERAEGDGKRFTIGFIGRIEPIKNLDVLVDAFDRICGRFNNCRLVIAGRGSHEASVASRIQGMSCRDKVEFVGYVRRDKKDEFFRSIDLLVVPSKYEPFGLVILEAMRAGVPVIASKVGGIPEIIRDRHNGVLFSPDDPGALAETILSVLSSPSVMRGLAVNGKKSVKDYFNWERAARQYDQIFKKELFAGQND